MNPPSQGDPALMPRTCDYFTLHAPNDFVNVVKLRIVRGKSTTVAWVLQVGPVKSQRSLEEQGRRNQRRWGAHGNRPRGASLASNTEEGAVSQGRQAALGKGKAKAKSFSRREARRQGRAVTQLTRTVTQWTWCQTASHPNCKTSSGDCLKPLWSFTPEATGKANTTTLLSSKS